MAAFILMARQGFYLQTQKLEPCYMNCGLAVGDSEGVPDSCSASCHVLITTYLYSYLLHTICVKDHRKGHYDEINYRFLQ